MPVIERKSLRSQVLDELRRRILDGEVPAASRINETRLSAELGVSRTPLREALHGLEREGLVVSQPGRGFAVRQLDRRDVNELYPLRALLEPEALRLAGAPDVERIGRLRERNDELAETARGSLWIERDDRWHSELVGDCPNRHLLEMIAGLRRQTLRYEHAFLQSAGGVEKSLDQHRRILDALDDGDVDTACRFLAANMLVSIEPILRRLR